MTKKKMSKKSMFLDIFNFLDKYLFGEIIKIWMLKKFWFSISSITHKDYSCEKQ